MTAGLASAQYLETTLGLNYGLAQALWNPANNHLYVSSAESFSVTVIDGATNQVTTTIRVPYDAYWLCLNPTASKVYCSSGERDTLSVIDTGGDTLLRSLRVRGYPNYMACDPVRNKLYVVCSDDRIVRVYDAGGDTLVSEIVFGQNNSPSALLWYPGTNRIFCTTGAGGQSDTVFVINSETDSIVARTAVGRGPREMCFNSANGLVYVDCVQSIHVLSPAGDSVVAAIPLDMSFNNSLCAIPSVNKLYAARTYTISVIDCGSHKVTKVGGIPYVSLLACDTNRDKVYCTSRPVEVYDARADSTLLTIPVDAQGYGFVAWNRTDSRMYMMNVWYDSVLVIRDTTTGVAEPTCQSTPYRIRFPTISKCKLWLDGEAVALLLDATGRRAAVLKPGINDVDNLKSGVYFVRPAGAAPPRKVIIEN